MIWLARLTSPFGAGRSPGLIEPEIYPRWQHFQKKRQVGSWLAFLQVKLRAIEEEIVPQNQQA